MKYITDVECCPKCSKLETVRILKIFGMCITCNKKHQYDNIDKLHLTVDGNRVYYAFQEGLSKYANLFSKGADGGVVANSTLPPDLNKLARYYTLMYLTKYYNIHTDAFCKVQGYLGGIKEIYYLRDILKYKVLSKYPQLHKKYDNIGEIK